MQLLSVLAALCLWLLPSQVQAFDHQPYSDLLQQVVVTKGFTTQVDYQRLQHQQQALQAYLQRLSAITPSEFASWSAAERLAFLINAYNAWTLELVLSRYPNLDSIKDLGRFWQTPWQQDFIPLLGKTRSLDEIEHQMIRGPAGFNEPRIHFAVNCASIGCPALREEAYTAAQLERQLTEQTERFLKDSSRNTVKGNTLYLSAIFKWYNDDFTQPWRGSNSLQGFLAQYADALSLTLAQQEALQQGTLKVRYLAYDWALNDLAN